MASILSICTKKPIQSRTIARICTVFVKHLLLSKYNVAWRGGGTHIYVATFEGMPTTYMYIVKSLIYTCSPHHPVVFPAFIINYIFFDHEDTEPPFVDMDIYPQSDNYGNLVFLKNQKSPKTPSITVFL